MNASDSKDVVDQMIPAGSGKSAIDNILGISKEDKVKEKNMKIKLTENEEAKHSVKIATNEKKNAWKQPSPLKNRGGKQGAWREATGPSKGIGFKGAGRGGKTGLHSWRRMLASNGPSGLPKVEDVSLEKANKADSSAGLKAILGVTNEVKKLPAADATMGLKNMLGIASSLPKVQPKVESKEKQNVTSAADALMQLMVQSPGNIQQTPGHQQQSQFNFTYVKEGDVPPPPLPPSSMPHPSMIYPQGQGYYAAGNPQMYYPAIIPQPMMMAQHPINSGPVASTPIPINREKNDNNGVGTSGMIPSTAVNSKK